MAVEVDAELDERRARDQAEFEHRKAMADLEVERAKRLAEIEVEKFGRVVSKIGKDAVTALAAAPPDEQARIMQALGLNEGSLFGDCGGDDPIALLCNSASAAGRGGSEAVY